MGQQILLTLVIQVANIYLPLPILLSQACILFGLIWKSARFWSFTTYIATGIVRVTDNVQGLNRMDVCVCLEI